jgi:septal ring factor EnvC (AmiA/AmiB activator)
MCERTLTELLKRLRLRGEKDQELYERLSYLKTAVDTIDLKCMHIYEYVVEIAKQIKHIREQLKKLGVE